MTGSPYKGLAAFDDSAQDVAVFFGREGETEVICANLMASRLTVLYGETGVGKDAVDGERVPTRSSSSTTGRTIRLLD